MIPKRASLVPFLQKRLLSSSKNDDGIPHYQPNRKSQGIPSFVNHREPQYEYVSGIKASDVTQVIHLFSKRCLYYFKRHIIELEILSINLL